MNAWENRLQVRFVEQISKYFIKFSIFSGRPVGYAVLGIIPSRPSTSIKMHCRRWLNYCLTFSKIVILYRLI